jgi:hypothetical protein
MTYKIVFTSGIWRTIEADHVVFNENTLALIKDGRPVFTAVMQNVCYWCEDAEPTPVPLVAQVGGFAARV